LQRTKALGLEVVPAQRTQIPQRCFSISDDWRPQRRGSQCIQLLHRDREAVAEERHCETLPLAGLGQLFKPREELLTEGVRPGGLVEYQLADAIRDFGRSGKRSLTDFPLEFGRSFSSILWQISSLPSCKPDAIPVYIPP
jgi:hypothetical protein